MRRGELAANEALLQEFENQWALLLESLKTLNQYSKTENVKLYLESVYEGYSSQNILATPCYDGYIKDLKQANESFIACDVLAIFTGGEALPACAIYYLNELRTAYNTYTSCMDKTYNNQQGKE